MKKLVIFLIAIMFVSAMPEIVNAQSNDPFEQQTLKARDNTKKREKKINRRKNAEPQEAPAPQAPKQEPAKKPVVKEKAKPVVNEMTLSNPCEEWLDIEFISLIGSRASQTLTLTLKVTNHGLNQYMNIGGSFVAYDSEGEEHSRGWAPERYNTLTDIPFKTSFDIPGKINPTKTTVLPIMKFNVGDCSIEMRNIPIDWK